MTPKQKAAFINSQAACAIAEMTRYEVRCCCEPLKLLGWLTTDLKPGVLSQYLSIPTSEQLRPMSDESATPHQAKVEVCFRKFCPSLYHRYWAIDAHEQPIELWRLLPNFEENKHDTLLRGRQRLG